MIVAAVILYLFTSAVIVVFAGRYIFRDSFLPYHGVAMGKSWSELEPRVQWGIRAILTVCGGGMLASGVTGALLALLLLDGHSRWLTAVVPVPYLTFAIVSFYATARLKRLTGAQTPVVPSIALIVVPVVAYILSVLQA